jgi:hypothetical protein
MSRHMDNLECLCNDLDSRYGELDPMVLQVKTEMEACKTNETNRSVQHDWATPYRTLVKDRGSEFMRRISS